MGRAKKADSSLTQKQLSQKIGQAFSKSIGNVLSVVTFLAMIVTLVLIVLYVSRGNRLDSRYYASSVDTAMQEKISMISSIAAAIDSGTITEHDAVADFVDAMVEIDPQVSAVYSTYNENVTIMSGGWQPPEGFDVTQRGWFIGAQEKPDEVFISDPYVDEQSGGICITLAKATRKDGKIIGVVGMDMYMDDLVTLIQDSYKGGNYVFLSSADGMILVHPNEDYSLKVEQTSTIEEVNHGRYQAAFAKDMSTKLVWDYKGGLKFATSYTASSTGWKIVSIQSLSGMFLALILLLVVFRIIFFVAKKLTISKSVKRTRALFDPLESISGKMQKVADGDLAVVFDEDRNSTEIEKLTDSLNETIDSLSSYINQISNTVTAISDKDLTVSIDTVFKGNYLQIKVALESILLSLNGTFKQIREESERVYEYAQQLEQTSESVADAATSQNMAINTVAEDMERLNDQTKSITERAQDVGESSELTNKHLLKSAEEMSALVEAMNLIEQSSEQIVAFADEIANIADQTNLLALNASIEAARAGEAGRGFAVVAGEIGSLAASSAEASENISRLIVDSKEAVLKGKQLVETTAQTMEQGVSDSVESKQQIDDIVEYVKKQQMFIEHINEALKEVAQVVESNAASAQENTAISQQLSGCAQMLLENAESFKLKE